MQNFFVKEAGYKKNKINKLKLQELLASQLKAIEISKQHSLPIIFVKYEYSGMKKNSHIEIIKELSKATEGYDKSIIFHKSADGLFSNENIYLNEIHEYLEQQEIKNLFVAGVNGGGCVRATILDALKDYNVVALTKGIADLNDGQFEYPYSFEHTYSLKTFNWMKCATCNYSELIELEKMNDFF